MFFIVALVSSSTIGNPKELPISLLPLPLPPSSPLLPAPSTSLPPSPLPLPLPPPNSVCYPLKSPPPPSSAMVDSPVEVEKFMSLAGILKSSSRIDSVDEVEGLPNGISDLKPSIIL